MLVEQEVEQLRSQLDALTVQRQELQATHALLQQALSTKEHDMDRLAEALHEKSKKSSSAKRSDESRPPDADDASECRPKKKPHTTVDGANDSGAAFPAEVAIVPASVQN